MDPVIVPAITASQQLAEKLHAYTRIYRTGENDRAKDLYDMLVIAEQLPIPSLDELVVACKATFSIRNAEWPPSLNRPPATWAAAWHGFVEDYHLPFVTLDEAYQALGIFWAQPMIGNPVDSHWSSESRSWSA